MFPSGPELESMNRILAAAALPLALSVSLAHADSVFERAQEKFAEEAKTPDEFPKITAEVMAKLAAEHCLPVKTRSSVRLSSSALGHLKSPERPSLTMLNLRPQERHSTTLAAI